MANLTLYPAYRTSNVPSSLNGIISPNGTGEGYVDMPSAFTVDQVINAGSIFFNNRFAEKSKACVVSGWKINFLLKNGNTFATSGNRWDAYPIKTGSTYSINGTTISSYTGSAFGNHGSKFTRNTDYQTGEITFSNSMSDTSLFGTNNLLGMNLSCYRETTLVSTQAYLKNLTATVEYTPRFYARFYDDSGNLLSEDDYNANATVAVPSATSKVGYAFAGWRSSKDNVLYTSSVPSSYDTDISFTAVYSEITHAVKFSKLDSIENKLKTKIEVFENNQWVEKAASRFREGTKIRVSIKSDYDAKYNVRYSLNGGASSLIDWDGFDVIYESDFLNANIIVRYFATEVTYYISSSALGNVISFSDDTTALKASNFNYNILIAPNSYINLFTINGDDKSDELVKVSDTEYVYLFQDIQENKYIRVSAIRNDKTVTKITDGHGTITGADVSVLGDTNTFTITPNDHYRISEVLLDGVSVMDELAFADGYATYELTDTSPTVAPYRLEARFREVVYATFNGGEHGSITGDLIIDKGDTAFFSISADEGYFVDNVKTVIGNVEDEYQATFAQPSYWVEIDEINSDITIIATFTNDTSTVTVTQPEHGNINADTAEYINGSVLTLYCEANEGYKFVDWWNESTDNPQSYTVNGDVTISANIVAYNWTVTSSVDGKGSVVPAQASADTDEVLTFTAVPNAGYKFVEWEDGSSENPRSITVAESLSIEATFEKDSFEVSVGVSPADAGTVTGEGTYEFEEEFTLTATPTESYRFSHWIINGQIDTSDDVGNSSRIITTPPQNAVYKAVFSKITYDADVSVGEGGSVYPMIDTVEHGSTVNFTFTNKIGCKLSDFRVNGVSLIDEVTTTQTGGKYTLSNITSAISVEVEFEEKLYSYGRKLIDYYPQVLKEILELIALMNAQEPIIGECWDAVSFLMDNQFIDTATVEGVEVWEKELGIIPNSTDTLKDRKQRLKALWVPAPRYTWGWLLNWLKVACNTSELKEPILNDYTLNIYLPATSDYFNVIACLKRYIPANIKLNPVLKIKDIVHDHYAGIGASVTLHLKTSAYDDLTDYPEKSDTGGLI